MVWDGVIAGSNVRAGNLEKIADFFQVPIDYFFEREVEVIIPKSDNPEEVLSEVEEMSLQKEVEFLKKIISEKERFIQYLLAQNEKKLVQKNDDMIRKTPLEWIPAVFFNLHALSWLRCRALQLPKYQYKRQELLQLIKK